MKKIFTLLLFLCIACAGAWAQAPAADQAKAAKEVIEGFMGTESGLTVEVTVDPNMKENDKDKFTYTLNGSTLNITASNGVAACRGFYDFVKSNGAGICSWTANRFDAAKATTSATVTNKEVTSAYRDHQYFNVVTYGYTTPYWDAARWDKEIEWMALHGIDMPLMLVGSEGIYFDTFTQDFNVPAADVHSWEVGPAHLPWMRMGNLAGQRFDGPLDQHWYDQQKTLAHHILKKMYKLGMRPILPAFGGFVPPAFADHNSCGTLGHTGWDWVISRGEYNTRLNPDSEYFVQVGQKFIERWEKEFSSSYPGMKYYLSDSFNEMTVPGADQLAVYGEKIFKSINEADKTNNPGAERVWVTQGWEFGYGSGKWTNGSTTDQKFKALAGSAPKDQFMVLFMSNEYGGNKANLYDNFGGWEWINTMLPNMGGKNFWTGNLNNYARTQPQYNGGDRGNLTGWGMTMEATEYDELRYELIADMGWAPTTGRDLGEWFNEYGKSRYGEYTDELKALHNALRNTVYTNYKDHIQFGWQGYNKKDQYYTAGNINPAKQLFEGLEAFFSPAHIATLKANGLDSTLRADLIEYAAFYAAARVENINKRIITAINMNKRDDALASIADLEKVMYNMDRALSGHPLYDLQKWEDKAKKAAGDDEARQKQYVKDARSIVSTWHSGHGSGATDHEAVNDYACRIWAGLIRGYYLPRLKTELLDKLNKTSTNLRTLENNFVSTADSITLMPVQAWNATTNQWEPETEANALAKFSDADLLDFLKQLVDDAQTAGQYVVSKENLQFSTLSENHWYAIHSQNANSLERVFTSTGTQTDLKTGFGISDLSSSDAQLWRFIRYADSTIRIENRNGQSLMYENGAYRTTLVNVGTDASYLHDNVNNNRYAFRLANAGNYMTYNGSSLGTSAAQNGSAFIDNATWTLENVDAKVNEISRQSDYDRLRARISGFSADVWGVTSLYGSKGQPRDLTNLNTMISHLSSRDAHDPLITYSGFLQDIYGAKLKECFDVPDEDTQAYKLFDLIMSAMSLRPSSSNADATTAFRSAMIAAQQAVADGNESVCQAQYTTLQTAIKTYLSYITPREVTTLKAGNTYILKNVSNQRNACLYEESDGKLHITSDVTTQLSPADGFCFTFVADGDNYKLRAASGRYIPALTQTKSSPGSNHQSTSATGTAYTFTYSSNYWTIKQASDASKYLYCFGPSYNGGRLLTAGSGDIEDGGKWKIYLVAEAPNDPTDDSLIADWSSSDWTNSNWSTSNAASKTNFYSGAYIDVDNVSVSAANSNVSAVVSYSSGTHAQATYGIELLQNGNVVKSYYNQDGDRGYVGGSPNNVMTYTVTGVDAGTYTLRVWSSATKGTETMTANGTIVTKVNDSQVGSSFSWNDTNWKIDNILIPAEVKNSMPKIGVSLNHGNGARYYRYYDKEVTYDRATTLTTTVTSTGSPDLQLIGVELLQNDNLLTTDGTYDGHYGSTGSSTVGNTYRVAIPTPGTYTVRLWASYVNNTLPASGTVTYEVEPVHPTYVYIRHANPNQNTKHLNVADNGTATNIAATPNNFRSLWTLIETDTQDQYKIYNEYTGKYLANTGNGAVCTVTDNEANAAVVAIASVTPGSTQPTNGMTNVVSLTNTATSKYLFNNADANTNIYFGYAQSIPSNSWGCQFVIEECSQETIRTWAQNLLGSIDVGYVGGREETDELRALQASYDAEKFITATMFREAEAAPVLTLSDDKYYVIESAINSKIGLCKPENQIAALGDRKNKLCFYAIDQSNPCFVWRFINTGQTVKLSDSSEANGVNDKKSGWGDTSATVNYPIYNLYNIGAQNYGYLKWGTYDGAATFGNEAECGNGYGFKVVQVDGTRFQISSCKGNDNYTPSIDHNGTVNDNYKGDAKSHNTYGSNTNVSNIWRIREVEAPTGSQNYSATITDARAATLYVGFDSKVPEGVVAKYLHSVENANATETSANSGMYTLTYEVLEEDDVIPANMAVVITGEPGSYTFTKCFEPRDWRTDYLMFGYATDQAVSGSGHEGVGADGNVYALGNKTLGVAFYHFNKSNYTAHKGYLDAAALLPEGQSATRAVGFYIIDPEGTVTSVHSLSTGQGAEGQLYDMQGRMIQTPRRGQLYVGGGKKILF